MPPRAVPEPDFGLGSCTKHPSPDWWTSPRLSERQAAIRVCSGCPVLAGCREWSMTLAVSEAAVYGGLLAADRRRRKQQLRAAEAARLAARREYGRRSEAKRRQAGKAPTTKERYASGEAEMFKASAASYYAQHAEAVKEKRKARHERDKDAINARRREQWAAKRSAA